MTTTAPDPTSTQDTTDTQSATVTTVVKKRGRPSIGVNPNREQVFLPGELIDAVQAEADRRREAGLAGKTKSAVMRDIIQDWFLDNPDPNLTNVLSEEADTYLDDEVARRIEADAPDATRTGIIYGIVEDYVKYQNSPWANQG